MEKARITQRTLPDGKVRYYIQREYLRFCDFSEYDEVFDMDYTISFETLKEAIRDLRWYGRNDFLLD